MACIFFYPHKANHHPQFFKEQLLLLCTSLLSQETLRCILPKLPVGKKFCKEEGHLVQKLNC